MGDIAVCTYHEPQVKKCGIKRKKTNLHFQTNIVIHLLFISKEEQINEHSQSNRYVFANYKKEVVNYSCTQPSMSGWVSYHKRALTLTLTIISSRVSSL